MILIWGSSGDVTTVKRGNFHCPQCRAFSPYRYQHARRMFTLFFIPLFETKSLGRWVECRICGSTFKPAVLKFSEAVDRERYLKGVVSQVLLSVVAADNVFDATELDTLQRMYRHLTGHSLRPIDMEAYTRLAPKNGDSLAALQDVVNDLDASHRRGILRAAIAVAGADGIFQVEEQMLLEKLAGIMDIPTSELHQHVRAYIDAVDRPVVLEHPYTTSPTRHVP